MNWSRAKSILILFFLFTNAFLLFNIINSARVGSRVSPLVVDSSMEFLAKNQITIERAMIPQKNYSLAMPKVQNSIGEYSDFAKNILGDGMVEETEGVFRSQVGEIRFQGDRFVFVPADARYGDFGAGRISKGAVTSLLKGFGLDLTGAKVEIQQDGATQVAWVTKNIAGFAAFDCAIGVFVSEQGLMKIEGSWFMEIEKPFIYEKTEIKNAPSALVEFCTLPSRPDVEMTILGLELGYVVGNAAKYHETATLVPVWRITTAADGAYYIDAI